ncbi:DUF3179 domain-containing protein [Azoarcus sp. DN11]|uniref:DUF3179 domain-containing protein n=1 Tax=Azoarcus sp. DN11 TaxID=356837 RepID=UPI000EB00913|nr:DUF3179 domain-containing protein [Azoarcus sp. DN11]AYH42175.1 hypothetical protein CDA09_02035 [Azoarcus sp. DN11]
MKRRATILLTSVLLLVAAAAAVAQTRNGFDLTGALVPAAQILSGGPPRDGIPAIDRPKFVKADDARFLQGDDRVLGVERNGIAKAYPVRILNWHEIVNDTFGAERIVVTFCPLCGTGIAYVAETGGKTLDFGVSGLLYNSDVLFYDRQSQSLWSQILAQAVSGPLKGAKLATVALAHTSWADWRQRHPDTLVLSNDTGFARDYDVDPYAGYARDPSIMFPVTGRSARYQPKEPVIGVEVGGKFKAYPFVELAKIAGGTATDLLDGKKLTVRFDPQHRTGAVFDAQGREMPSIIAYWFAWYAFHHDTEVFQAK